MKNYIKRNIKKIFNQKLFYIILCFLFLIIPIILFILLLLGKEKSAIDSWAIGVSFYGALLGGLGTIIAFIVTSQQTKKIQKENIDIIKTQFNEEKRISIKPYLKVATKFEATPLDFKSNYIGNVLIEFNKEYINISSKESCELTRSKLFIEIKNLGLGPAIDINIAKLLINGLEIKCNHYSNSFDVLDKNDLIIFCFKIKYLDKLWYYQNFSDKIDLKESLINKYKEPKKNLTIHLEYVDIFDNKYLKIIDMSIEGTPVTSLHELPNDTNNNKLEYKLKNIDVEINLNSKESCIVKKEF